MQYAGLPEVYLPIPSGWEDRSQIIVVQGGDDEFRRNIVVVQEPLRARTVDEFIESHLETLNQTFTGFSLRLREPVAFGHHHGHLLDYGFTASEKAYRQRQFIVPHGDAIYTFTYSDLALRFDPGVVIMEQVVGATRLGEVRSGDDAFVG